MTDREKTTEMFLTAQGYDQDTITRAISVLTGSGSELMHPDSAALTPKELCLALKISMTTLWRLDPPHIVVGCRKRYQLAEVKEFLEERRNSKTSLKFLNKGSA